VTAPSYPTTCATTATADLPLEIVVAPSAHRAVIPFVCAIPKSSRHDTHRRVARFAAAISSHPKRSSNRAAPSLIETRNQLHIEGVVRQTTQDIAQLVVAARLSLNDVANESPATPAFSFCHPRRA
jgi:hypothetical protein